jgi:hypothetical protein
MEWGYGRWLGDEWVDAIALGTERASPEAARELADEVTCYRKLRRLFAREVRTYGEMLEENHSPAARGLLLAVASRLCTTEELYGDDHAPPAAPRIERRALLRLAAGETATPAEVDALADEVLVTRGATAAAVAALIEVAAAHPAAADAIRAALVSLAPIDEIYPCPPTDTPPSAASGAPPPRARSNG